MKAFHTASRVSSKSGEKGSALIEGAFTLLIFLTIFFGIMEFGRIVWAYGWTAHISREAARWASVRGGDSGIDSPNVEDFVKNRTMGLNPDRVTVSEAPTWEDPVDRGKGTFVRVTVSYQVMPVVAFLPGITVQSTSQTTIAQ